MPNKLHWTKNLKLDDDTYEGMINIDDTESIIYVEIDKEQKDDDMKIAFCNEIINWYEENSKKVKSFASNKLLELKNTHWVESDTDVVTEDEFITKIKLESIAIHKDKSITFFFKDGNLFLGHCIMVGMNKNCALEYAEIAG